MRILILGGSGVFGGRLAELLSRDPRLELIIAGRDEEKAKRVAANLRGPARVRGARVVVEEIDAALATLRPSLVIHCAGPFQGQDYAVAKAAIASRIPYLDLSDGREFCDGFRALDGRAREAGVFALTACSTTTALTSAAALTLSQDMSSVERIRVGVTPGNRAPRGRAVVEAILSYVGEPIPVVRDGDLAETTGWGTLSKVTLPKLGGRWFSPCDAPDIQVMRHLFRNAHSIEFCAGLELSVLHLPLYLLATMRRRRIIPNLARASGVFHTVARWFEPFGTDQGGMFVELEGAGRDGRRLRRRWTLWAGSGEGPYIPAMGAAIIAKEFAAGSTPAPGARLTAGEVPLAQFEEEFARFDITTQTEECHDTDDVSGDAWRPV